VELKFYKLKKRPKLPSREEAIPHIVLALLGTVRGIASFLSQV